MAVPERCAIEANDIGVYFGKIVALDGLSICIPGAASFGLVGPNGAGKTTLIRVIAGLLRPTQGDIRVFETGDPHSISRNIGYMPQTSGLYGELSVRENVDFFARVCGLSQRKRRSEQVERSIELVGLWERRDDPVLHLSGGMRQRVSLASAIVHQPRLLVLDEPTVGLDPELRVSVWRHFHQLTREGVTLVVSSHTMDDAAHCDRLAFLREGKVVAEGSPGELVAATGTSGATLEDAFLFFLRREEGSRDAR
jgi:ABC-2 type transport system ATP-binding protein